MSRLFPSRGAIPHLCSPQFRGLVELLQGDGYRVRPFTEAITSLSLTGIDALVVSGPGGWAGPDASLSDSEVADLTRWIQRGGSLFSFSTTCPLRGTEQDSPPRSV